MPNYHSRKKFLVYVRVSTLDQHTENQMPDLINYMAQHNIHIPPMETWDNPEEPPKVRRVRWLVEKASGYKIDRDKYWTLMRAIKRRRYESVLVWRLDRLGRLALSLHKLFMVCRATDTNIISLRENLDLTTSTGRFFASIMAALAELEGGIRAERQRAGNARVRARLDKIMHLHSEGLPLPLIAEAVKIDKSKCETVIQRNGKAWWGGAIEGAGRQPGPCKALGLTKEKLASYLAIGMKPDEIATMYRITGRTVRNRMDWYGLRKIEDIPPEVV